MLRVELRAPPSLAPLLEWCRAAPRRFTARRAWKGARRNGAAGMQFETAAAVLGALEQHGFCRRLRRAAATAPAGSATE